MTIGLSTRAVSAPVGVALRNRFGKEPVKYVPLSQFFTSREPKGGDDDSALYGRRRGSRKRKRGKEPDRSEEPRQADTDNETQRTKKNPRGATEAREGAEIAGVRDVSEDQQSFRPPKSVQKAAALGLELRKKHGRGGLTSKEAGEHGIGSGVQRAANLKNGDNVSLDTIKRMHAFFSRHQKNKGKPGDISAGRIAWLLWGGDPGWDWAKSVLRQQEESGQPVAHVDEERPGRCGSVAVTADRTKPTKVQKRRKKRQEGMTTTANIATTPVPVGAGDGRKFLDYGPGHPYHGRDFGEPEDKRKRKRKRKSLSRRLSYLLTIP